MRFPHGVGEDHHGGPALAAALGRCRGDANVVIGLHLGTHVENIYRTLDVTNRVTATLRGLELGLLPEEI